MNARITYLEGAIVKQYSKMMPIVVLSTTKAELYLTVLTAQDIMFVHHILLGMELQVKLSMILFCDNKGAVELANNWSARGRTWHINMKQNFLQELKVYISTIYMILYIKCQLDKNRLFCIRRC